jgi:hypothetical protein
MTKKYIYFLEVVRPPYKEPDVDHSFSALTVEECIKEIEWRFEEWKKSHVNEKYEMHTTEGSNCYRFIMLSHKHYGSSQNRVVLTYIISKLRAPTELIPFREVLS